MKKIIKKLLIMTPLALAGITVPIVATSCSSGLEFTGINPPKIKVGDEVWISLQTSYRIGSVDYKAFWAKIETITSNGVEITPKSSYNNGYENKIIFIPYSNISIIQKRLNDEK